MPDTPRRLIDSREKVSIGDLVSLPFVRESVMLDSLREGQVGPKKTPQPFATNGDGKFAM